MSSEDRQLTLLNYLGTTLYGFCNGYFGDVYEDKTIVGIGSRWVVCSCTLLVNECKEHIDTFVLAVLENSEELVKLIERNSKDEY